MSPIEPAMDDASLQAYVDGQLTAEEAAEVARWLQQHPGDAERVLAWQSQRSQLQALRLDLLDEPVPPRLLAARLPSGPVGTGGPWRVAWRRPAADGLWTAAAMLLLGLGLGWSLRPLLAAADHPGDAANLAAAAIPPFVRDAAVAHALYTPERRHPVEVGAEQQEHLVQWLSKRLGTPLRVPVLTAQGYQLVGGRLLPGISGASADPAVARAQFMYEHSGGERLTLYVSVQSPPQEAGGSATSAGTGTDVASTAAFRFTSSGSGPAARHSFYWLDGRLGYALTGQVERAQLSHLAETVYRQLNPARPGS
jgi:anti-sigma factor RsiW